MEYEVIENGKVILSDTAEVIREYLEQALSQELGFYPALQECDDDELEIYLHTCNYEDLDDLALEHLDKLGITEDNSLQEICKILNISILPKGITYLIHARGSIRISSQLLIPGVEGNQSKLPLHIIGELKGRL